MSKKNSEELLFSIIFHDANQREPAGVGEICLVRHRRVFNWHWCGLELECWALIKNDSFKVKKYQWNEMKSSKLSIEFYSNHDVCDVWKDFGELLTVSVDISIVENNFWCYFNKCESWYSNATHKRPRVHPITQKRQPDPKQTSAIWHRRRHAYRKSFHMQIPSKSRKKNVSAAHRHVSVEASHVAHIIRRWCVFFSFVFVFFRLALVCCFFFPPRLKLNGNHEGKEETFYFFGRK